VTRFILALLGLLAALPAHAQNVPYFPQVLPSGTVIGRLTTGPGPAEAIPNALLLRALTAGAYTSGRILYAGSNGYLSQDNTNLFYDATNKRLGMGTVTPSYTFHAYNSAATAAMLLESGAATSGSLIMLNRAYSTTVANGVQIWQDSSGTMNLWAKGSSVLTANPAQVILATGTTFSFLGATSGSVTLGTQAVAGTWNLNLPITAGTAGQFLVSGGGGSTAMTTNDAAAAGYVGETITSTVLTGSAVSLATTTAKTVTSVSLTAGEWNVCGNVLYTNGGTTTTTVSAAAFNTTTDTLPTAPANGWSEWGGATLTGPSISHTVGCHRVSTASTISYFLVTRATFATSTSTAYGSISARRVR
jgi:hypothetical protein